MAMRRLAALLLLLAAACADARPTSTNPEGFRSPTQQTYPSPEGQLFSVTALVLEDATHGPKLCLSFVTASSPPQCGDIPITNWTWDVVEGETRQGRTISGRYHIIGMYDRRTFTLTQPPGAPQTERPARQGIEEPPCPEPAGGWGPEDPASANQSAFEAAVRAAEAERDFGGLWVFEGGPGVEDVPDYTRYVLIVAFTGDLERHEAEIREIWGGPLCLVKHTRTAAQLDSITRRALDLAKERRLFPLTAEPDYVHEIVKLKVGYANKADIDAFDAEFGKGIVVITSRLKPV